MAAFTEGFSDTTGGKGHLGSVISKAIAARRFAQDERKLAEEKAKKAGYDSLEEIGVEKGYFFKAALKSKFGGAYLSGKKQDISAAVDRVKLLKNPKAQFWNFVDNRDSEGKDVKKLNDVERFRKQFDNYAFVSAKRPPEKEVKAETEVAPKKMSPFQLEQARKAKTEESMLAKTEAKTAKAASGGGGSRVSREDILTAVSAIASSLEKTAQSINNTIGETKVIAEGVQSIKTDVVTQLSERTDSIESKLDAVVAAINAQTELQRRMNEDAKGAKTESRAEEQGKAADSGDFDDLTTDKDESADDKLGSELNLGDIPSPAATSAQDIEFQQQDAYQEREAGGIVSGPDEGYLAKLHGDEMVIPLDNNYTQGQPSAMDGKVRPVPQTKAFSSNSYETGTPTKPPATSSLGGKVGFTNLDLGMGSKSDSAVDSMAQPLMDAMSLPMMVAGGTILSSVNQLMSQLGPENSDVAGEVAKIARPIADVFGLSNNLVNKASGGMKAEESSDKDKAKQEAKDKKKKGFFSNLYDKLKKIATGSPRGGGGGHSGGGGSNTPGSMSSGGMSGMAEFIGSKESGNSYTKLVGGAEDDSILEKSVSQLNREKGGQFAMGRYQIQMRTASEVLRNAGIDPDTFKFDQKGQDEIFQLLLERRGLNDYLSGKITEEEFAKNLSMEWAALPTDASGRGYYDGVGDNKSLVGWDQTLEMIRGIKDTSKSDPESPEDAGNLDLDLEDSTVNSAPEIAENYGLTTGQTFDFSVPGKGNYQAYKTETGFEIFKYGGVGALVGRNERMDTSNGKNAWLVRELIKAGESRNKSNQLQPPPSPDASAATPDQQQQALRPDSSKSSGSSGSSTPVVLNSGGNSRSTETSARPDSRTGVVPEGSDNSLTDAYNPTPVTSS
ncbi:hypothetical protein BOW87_gp010 [Synechococcus phage S-CAM3]|uniref:Uncharacterized protein n=1 Tax=Synechococcus phage S-CAM3 TaxID=1883366 RepID=A0A1D8KIN0_9CAUD|nr:hypothetical protein BOW87_gp010 [Synechococcus phage S-CAM3]AOV58515.1 hypothetical protein S250808_010 [Synechococcus phage S-CAM3]AOV58993.1 hypothetical protein C421010_010 [Synechococcus phage S-CAM3]